MLRLPKKKEEVAHVCSLRVHQMTNDVRFEKMNFSSSSKTVLNGKEAYAG